MNLQQIATRKTVSKSLPRLRLFALIASTVLCTVTAGPASAAVRNRWVYDTGVFQRGSNGTWVEYQNGVSKYFFVQTSQNADQIVLFDKSRSINVKLLARAAVVTRNESKLLTIPGGWLSENLNVRFEGRYAGARQWVPVKNEGVYFFAVSFSGDFNVPNARSTFTFAATHAAEHGTLLSDRIDFKTQKDRHLMVGWFNPVSGLGGWLAGTYDGFYGEAGGPLGHQSSNADGRRGRVYYLDERMREPQSSLSWVKRDYQSKGHSFRLGIATDNETGKVAVFATKPK